jgi:hypothetical protein
MHHLLAGVSSSTIKGTERVELRDMPWATGKKPRELAKSRLKRARSIIEGVAT